MGNIFGVVDFLTEEEARKKICPEISKKSDKYSYCMTSDCMSWREGKKQEVSRSLSPENPPEKVAGHSEWVQSFCTTFMTAEGELIVEYYFSCYIEGGYCAIYSQEH